MFDFKLPDLGEGIHEAEILQWFVKVGDTIAQDADLGTLETDKAAVTVPSPRGGVVRSLGGKVGGTVDVGAVIVSIEEAGGDTAPSARAPQPAASGPAPAAPPADPQATPTAAAAPAGAAGPVPAAPVTRRVARELGVDLRLVPPSGPGGRVTTEDVRTFAKSGGTGAVEPPAASAEPTSAPTTPSAIPFFALEPLPDFSRWGPVERQPLRSLRRKTARHLVTSMVVVPQVAHMDEADVTELDALRRRVRAELRDRPGARHTLLPFVIRAVASCLKRHPMFNVSLDPATEELVMKGYYGIGVAVDSGHGLVVPVVRDADRRSVLDISATVEDLAGRARESKLTVDELRGGTFSVTNVGPLGGTGMIPAVNYPEAAILGMARAQEKPVVRNGAVVVRTMLPLTLAFDHRVADGADAARFMADLIRLVSDPTAFLMEV
jgi:pyruvate dehydrogenase E2 component (dihydrolipoamide acetyltransferase)